MDIDEVMSWSTEVAIKLEAEFLVQIQVTSDPTVSGRYIVIHFDCIQTDQLDQVGSFSMTHFNASTRMYSKEQIFSTARTYLLQTLPLIQRYE